MDAFSTELKAIEALQKVMRDAAEARQLFARANMKIPEPLLRLFGEVASNGHVVGGPPGHQGTLPLDEPAPLAASNPPPPVIVPDLDPPDAPDGAKDDWIWITVASLSPINLMLGLLRDAGGPMSPRALYAAAKPVWEDGSVDAVFKIGTRLFGSGRIERADGAWRLTKPEMAPVLHEGYAWGPISLFTTHEVAIFRRLVIRAALEVNPSGLNVMEVVKMLNDEFKHVPASRDAVSTDLDVMEREGRVSRHHDDPRKWLSRPEG